MLDEDIYRKYIMQTALLRTINDEIRQRMSGLEIEKIDAKNEWIALEDDIAAAMRSPINKKMQADIDRDLRGALEGQTEERKQQLRRRAAWIADGFVRSRVRSNTLRCDHCSFDPSTVMKGLIRPRTLLDVHHLHPLQEGARWTGFDDFILLCPTCHRIEHERLKVGITSSAIR